MRTVNLGPSGPTVSALGLGCMGMSEFYGAADRDGALATMARAVDAGITFFDTADTYGVGDNERLVGEFLASGRVRRDDLAVATKFGPVRDPETRGLLGLRADPEYVPQACDASLERLGVDHIDLYYLHVPDPRVPIEDTAGTMAELVTAGKVRHLGLSNLTAEQIRAAHAVHPITAVQLEYSLFGRAVEEEIIPLCAELGIAFVANCPLARGLLTGAFTEETAYGEGDVRGRVSRFEGANLRHNLELLRTVREVADAHGATPAQVALAWLLHQSEVRELPVVPIPGSTRPAVLAENADAADLRLTAEDLAALEPLAAKVAGTNQH